MGMTVQELMAVLTDDDGVVHIEVVPAKQIKRPQ
jgi:hypothetical protein